MSLIGAASGPLCAMATVDKKGDDQQKANSLTNHGAGHSKKSEENIE